MKGNKIDIKLGNGGFLADAIVPVPKETMKSYLGTITIYEEIWKSTDGTSTVSHISSIPENVLVLKPSSNMTKALLHSHWHAPSHTSTFPAVGESIVLDSAVVTNSCILSTVSFQWAPKLLRMAIMIGEVRHVCMSAKKPIKSLVCQSKQCKCSNVGLKTKNGSRKQ